MPEECELDIDNEEFPKILNLKQIREKYLKPFSSKKKTKSTKISSKFLTHEQKHLKPGYNHYSCSDPSVESDEYFDPKNIVYAKNQLKRDCSKVLGC